MHSRSAIISLTALWLWVWLFAANGQDRSKTFRFLENSATNQWCLYDDEVAWKSGIDSLHAISVGGLTYSSGKLQNIVFTQTAESGDWTFVDIYFIDSRSQINRLERSVSIIPGDRLVKAVYAISAGRAVRQSRTFGVLSTNQTAPTLGAANIPHVPVVVRLQDFLLETD